MRRELTEQEKKKSYAKFFDMPYPEVAAETLALMKEPMDPALALPIQQRNDLLKPGYLEREAGYCVMPDGSGYVASYVKMPGVTLEMLEWWFAWHGMESLRYKIWDPNDHYEAHVSRRHLKQRLDSSLNDREKNWNTSDFVLENVGEGTLPLRISFRSPESFGFDRKEFESRKVTAICAHSGPPDWDIPRTTFVHFGRETEDGIELRTRFWMGYMIVNKKAVRTDFELDLRRVAGLAQHSPKEYTRLAAMLPQLYAENHGIEDKLEDMIPIEL